MKPRERQIRVRTVIVATILVLLVVPAALLISHRPEAPRVTATFLQITNLSRAKEMIFEARNHSAIQVHCIGFRTHHASGTMPVQAVTIDPLTSAQVKLPYHSDLTLLYFRRKDTLSEEAREMLDSVLKSVKISWPGLNPDSSANTFSITIQSPPEANPPVDLVPLQRGTSQ